MSHIREASKVTINTSYFHPAHQHYTDEAHIYTTQRKGICHVGGRKDYPSEAKHDKGISKN